jgi:hypothetical protein
MSVTLNMEVTMSFLMHNESTAIGASRPIRSNHKFVNHMVEVLLNGTSGLITACTVELQGGNDNTETCVSTNAAVGASAARVTNAAFYYQIAGTNYTVALNATGTILTEVGGTAFTQTITDSKYGGVVFVANASGTIRCIAPSGLATGVQAYNTHALCNAALDAIVIPSEWCYIGKVVVNDAGGGTTFGTTSLATIGVFYSAYSPFYTLYSHAFSEASVSAQRAMFMVNDEHADFLRTYISALTGTGKVTVKYTPAIG